MASGSAHILVLPLPAQGHIVPLIDLLQRLCVGFNLRFTIIVTPNNASFVAPLQNSHPSKIHTLILPLPSHPSLPSGVENIRDLGKSGILPMIASLKQLCPLISQWFRSHADPPVAIIYDFFLGWIASLAHQLAIPHFVYYPNGAFYVSVIEYCWSHESVRGLEAIQMNDLPGSPCFKRHELPFTFRSYVKNNPDWEILRDGMLSNFNAYGRIVSTFDAIEDKYVRYLMQERGHDRLYSVGSSSMSNEDPDSTGKMLWVFDWLDGCPSESVIYVCFGSQKFMSEEQMKGIAKGLEESGKRFVWVVKRPPRNGVLPNGFEEKMREEGRGIVVKDWAPQKRILGHRAVGGFLTHCGWNSTMEGIRCGVPFLTWPMEAEQFQNAWLLENDLRIGVRVCEGEDSVPDPQSFGSVLRLWDAESEDAKAARKRASDLKEKAEAAVTREGTTTKNTHKLAITLCQLAARSP